VSTYVALLDGGAREVAVEVEPDGPGRFAVRVGGALHRVDAFQHDYGTLSLLVDTASYAVTLDRQDDRAEVRVRGSVFPLEILDELRLRLRRAPGTFTVEGRQAVTAPVAGRVVRVLCRAGQPVRAGQPLLVLMAMQMENELKAPRDGTVVELLVEAGQAVEVDARLCVVG
jgi:biotin carboxyl carrier protein